MALIEIKNGTVTAKGQIALLKAVRRRTFKAGTKVAIMAFDDRIEVRPLHHVSTRMETAVASERSLAKDWNSEEEDAAWHDL